MATLKLPEHSQVLFRVRPSATTPRVHIRFYTGIWLMNHCASTHAIYSSCRIHYKLCHAGQQYFWIQLNCATITNQKKQRGDLLARTWNAKRPKPSLRIGTAAGLPVTVSHSHITLMAQQPVLPDLLKNVL